MNPFDRVVKNEEPRGLKPATQNTEAGNALVFRHALVGRFFRAAPAESEAPVRERSSILWLSPVVRSLTVAAQFRPAHRIRCDATVARQRLRSIWCGAALLMIATTTSFAEIVSTEASVSTAVQELIDGEPASVSADGGAFPSDGSALPMAASASLVSTNLDGTLTALGQGFAEFLDPARLSQANPQELALEVACYSNAADVSYDVQSSVTELRSVVFPSVPGLGEAGVDFDANNVAEIESRFFLSGAVIVWSTASSTDLSDVVADVRISVEREDTGATLFDTALTVAVDPSGDVEPTTTGPVVVQRVTPAILGAAGLDAASVAILENVEREGTLVLLLIPQQQHAYSYAVTADEAFTLRARIEARIQNAPGGTGVAVVLGRPFRELADFVELGLPGTDGASMQKSLNQAVAQRDVGLVSSPTVQQVVPNAAPCGAMGVEMMVVGLFLSFAGHRRRLAG